MQTSRNGKQSAARESGMRRGSPSSRRTFLRRTATIALAAPAVAATSAWLRAARPVAAGADPATLVIADNLAGNWITLDPAAIYEDNPMAAMNVVYETLYHLPDYLPEHAAGAETLALERLLEPRLAADLPDVSSDGRELTIPLRAGVRFQHTGNEMTAHDWVFSLRRLGHMRHNPAHFYTEYIEHVEAVDDRTLRIRLRRPNVAILALLSAPQFSVTDSALVAAHGGVTELRIGETDPALAFMRDNSAGTGPYQLVSFDANREVVLKRNPAYWGDAPRLDRLVWRQSPDPRTQLAAVRAGDADVAYSVDPGEVAGVLADPRLRLHTNPSLQVGYLAMSLRPRIGGPLVSKQLRQAIAHAIDYDGILRDLAGGRAIRPPTVVPLGLLGAEEARHKAYSEDLDRARRLFRESGHDTVSLTLTYSAGDASPSGIPMEALMAKIKADLQRVEGLTVDLNPMDGAQRLRAFREGLLQFTYSNWSADYVDVHAFAQPFGHTGGHAAVRVGYSNPAIDALLALGIAERDIEARARIYVAIQEQFIEDAVFLAVEQPDDTKVTAAGVSGVRPHPVYQLQLRDARKG